MSIMTPDTSLALTQATETAQTAFETDPAPASAAMASPNKLRLPEGLELLTQGVFVQTHAAGLGTIAAKRLDFALAGTDVGELARRLKIEPPRCGVVPEEHATSIGRAVRQ